MGNRRLTLANIQLEGRTWEEASFELQRFLEALNNTQDEGVIPTGNYVGVPATLQVGSVGLQGDPLDGWSSGLHEHPIPTGTPVGLGAANAQGPSLAFADLEHVHKRDLLGRLNDADVGVRGAFNFIDTSTFEWNIVDDAGSDELEISGTAFSSAMAINGPWTFRTAITSNPTAGRLHFDNATVTLVTNIYLNEIDADGADRTIALNLLEDGMNVLVWETSDFDNASLFTINGVPSVAAGVWTVPVTYVADQGTVPWGQNTGVTFAAGHVTGSSISHSTLADLTAPADDHTQYPLSAGRAGGQTLIGGLAATEILTLTGSSDADLGVVDITSPVTIDVDFSLSPEVDVIKWAPTIPSSGGVVAGFIKLQADITVDNALFINAAVFDNTTLEHVVNPGFAVATLFLAQPIYKTTTGGVNPIQSFILAAQPQFQNDGAGAGRTVANFYAVSAAAAMVATTSGDVLTMTNYTGLNVAPIWSTVAGTTIDFGTIRGVHMRNPAKGLFFPGAGVEGMVACIGLEMDNITFGVAGDIRAAVRSALNTNTNNWFLLNNGTAESDFGTGDIHLDDNTVIKFGATVAAYDMGIFWATGQSALSFTTALGVAGNPLYLEGNAADEWIFRHNSSGTLDIGIGFDVNAVVFGTTAPTPNSNNWFVQFAAPNLRQVQIGGEYSDVLWTAGGTIDVNGQAVSDLQAFKINSPSVILNGGTIADMSNLYVAAMPSFGATRHQALRVLGRHRQDGLMCHNEATLATLTADVAALALPPNNAGRFVLLQDADASGPWTIQGIVNVQVGDSVYFVNNGANAWDFGHEDGAAAAADRIITPTAATWTLGAREFAKLWYDPVATRWRILESNGA